MLEKDRHQIAQNPCPFATKLPLKDLQRGKMKVERPLHYYEELMRHDAHRKVGGRVRQRGWGRP